MGKGWTKGGNRQRNPTLIPGNGYEGWGKGGQKVGIVRETPPLPQAMGMKGGKRVGIGRASSVIFQTQFPVHFLKEFACFLPIDYEVGI